ncbi:MAG: ATP-binding cassette domain-containing protein, partial [Gemmatimonadota bacterium]|nr:ATP-binding cassette domain-containing protein [Gemmatimonadota bacterium]
FGSVQALDGADLTLFSGEVHALVGQNGAGKTTLGRILGGLLSPDAGTVRAGGRDVAGDVGLARAMGIAMVHQHFSLVPRFTGLDNIRLFSTGAWTGHGRPRREFRHEVAARAETLGIDVELDRPVAELGVGDRQRIELLKALVDETRILVLDEPTAVLAPQEVQALFHVLRRLAEQGTAICLIAHKLSEILAVSHRITVLREGRGAWSGPRTEATLEGLVTAMMGRPRKGDGLPARRTSTAGPIVAQVRDVRVGPPDHPSLTGISLDVRRGEIVGVAGVAGNGQRALAALLAGSVPPDAGTIQLPERAGWIPQDRTREGLVGAFTIVENVALSLHDDPSVARPGRLDWETIRDRAVALIQDMDVLTTGPGALTATLSGGNQQKLLTARELARAGGLLVAESPTRGLDIAAAEAVHTRLRRLTATEEPPGIVVISTDLDEILTLSDRIFVLHRGRLYPLPEDQRNPEAIGHLMLEGQAP